VTTLAAMHDTSPPDTEPTEPAAVPPEADGDEFLDGFDDDLESVSAALDALDADELDTAEALVEKLVVDPETFPADSA